MSARFSVAGEEWEIRSRLRGRRELRATTSLWFLYLRDWRCFNVCCFFNSCFCFITSVVMSFTFIRTLQMGDKLLSRQLTAVLQARPGARLGIPRKLPSSCYPHDKICLPVRPIHCIAKEIRILVLPSKEMSIRCLTPPTVTEAFL